MKCDAELVASQLIFYFTTVCKNFKFEGFYDKAFVNNVKELIKNKEEFTKYLDMIQIEVEEFFKILIYVAPPVFTSNLIKFIQENYLGITPTKKKK